MSGNDLSGNDVKQGKVLPMVSARVETQNLQAFEMYWNKVRGNRLVPSRCEIDPRGLEGSLSHAFILERITGGLARFRIAGSHLSDLTGLELRHMPISALFGPSSRDVLSGALTAAFDEPAIVRMQISSPGGFARTELTGEMVLLPLRSDLGDIDRVLGGLILDGQIGRTPRRIEILSEKRQSLVGYAGHSHQDSTDDAMPMPRKLERSQERAKQRLRESIAKTRAAPEANLDRSHLRLVVNND